MNPRRRCMSCTLVGQHTYDCADRNPMDQTTVITVVQPVESDPDARTPVPVWAPVALVAGAVLVALGWILNEPVSQLVWEAIPR